MKELLKALFSLLLFPIMVVWGLFKGLIDLADSMERSRRGRSRNRGVMCGPGGVGARGGRKRR